MKNLERGELMSDDSWKYETWTTKTGHVLKMVDMSDQHLLNSLKLFRRFPGLMDTLNPIAANVVVRIEKLERELKRRGLLKDEPL
jgi:hypothetical protein